MGRWPADAGVAIRRRRAAGGRWAIGGAALFAALAVAVARDPAPFGFDRALIDAWRVAGEPGVAVGGAAMPRVVVNLTALGSGDVLTLAALLACGLLLVLRRWRMAALLAAASLTGGWAVDACKLLVGRARPDVAGRLVEVAGLSFPSGHAANSAIMWLLLAAVAARGRSPAVRAYVFGAAALLVAMIGSSRVYLGVHWPTDVLAGWCFGGVWAWAWWRAGAGALTRDDARASMRG